MPEVQDVFCEYGDAYESGHAMTYQQQKAFRAIRLCRTSALGGHVDECPECGYQRPSYNSCRNRHCPKCQMLMKERWIENQSYDLLNIQYFHVVFTVPAELNPIFLSNQEKLYRLLFSCAAETLTQLACDKKYLGAQIGCIEVLHTWGQRLDFHPHIHCIVPGGGLNKIGQWVSSRKKFFIPVKVLSSMFRGKFLAALKTMNLDFHGTAKQYEDPRDFLNLVDRCYKKEWVTYCKPPFKDSSGVINYLGRYTHRVAISNNRILNVRNSQVTFKWRDYSDGNKEKVMTLSAMEFIRRFMLHILPKGFMKIRHYGLLGNRNKTKKLTLCKRLTNTPIRPKEKLPTRQLIQKLIGHDISTCPVCGTLLRQFTSLSPLLSEVRSEDAGHPPVVHVGDAVLGAAEDEDHDAQEEREALQQRVVQLREAVYGDEDEDVAEDAQHEQREQVRVHLTRDEALGGGVDAGLAADAGQVLQTCQKTGAEKVSDPDDDQVQDVRRRVIEQVAGLTREQVIAAGADNEQADAEQERSDDVSAGEGVLDAQKDRSAEADAEAGQDGEQKHRETGLGGRGRRGR